MRKLLLLAVAVFCASPAFAAQRATENRGSYDPATDTQWVSTKSGVPLSVTTAALPAGSNLIGQVTGSGTAGSAAAGVLTVQGIASMTNLKVDIAAQTISPLTIAPSSSATGANPNGLVRVNAGASTNATSVKGSAGRLFAGKLCNAAAYDVFFKLYNKASAPTVGTDTPAATIPIKAGTCQDIAGTWGIPLSTGIAYAITKLQADSDTTVVVAGDLTGYLVYA